MAVLDDLKPNLGVFVDPSHKLWVAEAEPDLDTLRSEKALKEGEVLIGIKITGICG